ncbi:unnamed protein product [Adineta steineri]|uniref:Uncharacterized protein n=1 Tax=Adineta steineri TaxID=433720 RepID=A0A814U797_9BILA|nr:unnamed protein product [Adineta steineri]
MKAFGSVLAALRENCFDGDNDNGVALDGDNDDVTVDGDNDDNISVVVKNDDDKVDGDNNNDVSFVVENDDVKVDGDNDDDIDEDDVTSSSGSFVVQHMVMSDSVACESSSV